MSYTCVVNTPYFRHLIKNPLIKPIDFEVREPDFPREPL